jgi:hypothetical protein
MEVRQLLNSENKSLSTIGATTMEIGPPNFWDPGTSSVLVPQLVGLSHFCPLIFFKEIAQDFVDNCETRHATFGHFYQTLTVLHRLTLHLAINLYRYMSILNKQFT